MDTPEECVVVIHQGRVDVLWTGSWSWPVLEQRRYICRFSTLDEAKRWIDQAGLRMRRLIDRRD